MADITTAGLVARNPEWAKALTDVPDVVNAAVAYANSLPLTYYTDADQEQNRRDLEACARLFNHPYGRAMRKPETAVVNHYREECTRLDRTKGCVNRAPGWPSISGI